MTAKGNGGGRILVGGEHMSEVVDRVSGGGEKYHPMSMEEARELLAPQAQSLHARAAEISPSLRANRVVFEATLLPNYLANSYFPDKLIRLLGLASLGSRPAREILTQRRSIQPDVATKSLIVAGDDSSLAHLSRLLDGSDLNQREKAAAEQLRQFSKIHLPRLQEVIRSQVDLEEPPNDSDHREAFEAILHPNPDAESHHRLPVSTGLLRKFEAYIRSLGGEVLSDRRDTIGGLTFLPVLLAPERVTEAAAFNPLRSIRRMPRIRPVPSLPLRSAPSVRRPAPVPAHDYAPEVLIFDAGIDPDADFFAGSAKQVDLTQKPPLPGCIEHGSAVTGAILYGQVQADEFLSQPVAQVKHFRCIPGEDTDVAELYWLLDRIEEQVTASDAILVNLSLGPEVVVDDGEPHRWTAKLDQIAYEQDVLFVVAAGNNGEEDYESNRIQVPADMVNGLSVGSCDLPHPLPLWSRASYSAVGPGRPGARIQPTAVSFGGDEQAPFSRLMGNGKISFHWGTSYAAPMAVHGLAKLSSELGDRCSASALRAFAVHFSEAHPDINSELEVGHGRLRGDYSDVLECGSQEVTVLYQASVDRDQLLGFQLPVPESLNRGNVRIRWTLSFASLTDPTEAVEYTKSGIEPTFRPHASIYSFRDPDAPQRSVKVDILRDPDKVLELVESGWKQSQNPVTRTQKTGPRASEASRRRGGKWETILQGQDRLRASSLWRPRLDIEYFAREGGALLHNSTPVDFSLLVTVESTAGLPVYQQARSSFSVLSELPVPILPRIQL
ncbi:S8 family peptidase [Kitasatospora sp. cg17-2]